VGAKVSIATPERYGLNPVIVTMAKAIADETKASLRILTDPRKAVAGADAVYTDAWASMGHEHEAEERAAIFAPYQVNAALMQLAKPMRFHALSARASRLEVTDQVIDSVNSVVFDQAENRLHIQKAILVWLLGGGVGRFPARSAHA
jgi:ornithine carbamoyltransferase